MWEDREFPHVLFKDQTFLQQLLLALLLIKLQEDDHSGASAGQKKHIHHSTTQIFTLKASLSRRLKLLNLHIT